MILQSLFHLYGELCRQGKTPEEGWGIAKVSHRLMLDAEGRLIEVISTRKTVKRGKKEVEVPVEMRVPMPVTRSNKIKPNFLCDSPSYVLGIDSKGKPERAKKCFEASKALHHEILDSCNSTAAKAILKFYDTWDPIRAKDCPQIHDQLDDVLSASNFIFNVAGTDALEDESIRKAWNGYYAKRTEKTGDLGPCLVTGKDNQKIAILHPKIKGVRGAQSSGANLVSFNAKAFCSYGHDGEQGKNAPISEYAAFAYGAALNYLLSDRKHVKIFGDTTVVFWSEHALTVCQDFMNSMLGDDDSITDETLEDVINHMKDGIPADLNGIRIDPDEPLYILGLAPNAARISVRFFFRNTFGQTMINMTSHQERMRLVHSPWEKDLIPLWQTLKATANPHSGDSASSPLLAGSFLRSVFTDSLYPAALYQNILGRIFSDQDTDGDSGKAAIKKISYVKAAFIKAYLLKNYSKKWEGKIEMAVNNNCGDISYVLGRMFSLLEDVQQSANPGINSTIKDRYFNSACATPASVFPVLLKLANAHFAKLDKTNPGLSVSFKKKLGNLMDKIAMPDKGTPVPHRLTLDEQGAFVLGYYQETQARYAGNKKEEK